jgi:bifunctional UDP-N-acetylglucosamine pyrophosphorylase/glucosamine-1-phosphate N-acetyltransferase
MASIILADGKSIRMKSSLPKVLHPLGGKNLLEYSIDTLTQVNNLKPIVVVGYESELVQKAIGERAQFVIQEPQLGTAHAVFQTKPLLGGKVDTLLVSYADMPLLTLDTYKSLLETHQKYQPVMTLLTLQSAQTRGFGRLIRDERGNPAAIVEEAVATPQQLAIQELNVGVYCFNANWLWDALPRVPISPKGEYFLTDLLAIALSDGKSIQTVNLLDPDEAIGINNRVHLAEAEAVVRKRINTYWMLEGITILDPATTYIESPVTIGQDSIILPNTYLKGNTAIGEGCQIGPNTILSDTQIGSNCKIIYSVLEKAIVESRVDIGPFAHLRKGAHLAEGVHMGNFGEIKNSYLGPGTKMGHFSYLGDANIGNEVNIGAGTITCNFDGVKKNPTEIGDRVFIGSDTMLVAPVKLGEGSRTGAGAVVTKDIPDYSLAVGVPARVIRKLAKPDV